MGWPITVCSGAGALPAGQGARDNALGRVPRQVGPPHVMEAGRGGDPQANSGSMAKSPKNVGVWKGRTVRLFVGYRSVMPPSIFTLRDERWPMCLGQAARSKTRVRPNAHWALAPVFVSSASTIPLRTSRPEILKHPFPQNESAAEILRFPR